LINENLKKEKHAPHSIKKRRVVIIEGNWISGRFDTGAFITVQVPVFGILKPYILKHATSLNERHIFTAQKQTSTKSRPTSQIT
jgi:hypothetical protein